MKKRLSEELIIGFLREAQAGMPVKECAGSTASARPPTTLWHSKFGRDERA